MRPRTSALAVFGFLNGLPAVGCVTTAWFLYYLAGLGEVAHVDASHHGQLLLAARIVAVCTVGPAILSGAFWLAARGVIRESQGAVIGRGLYRTGILISALSVLFAVGGKYGLTQRLVQRSPAGTGQHPAARLQPWLGVAVRELTPEQMEAFDLTQGVMIWSVEAGSPAEGVLKPGTVIIAINDQPIETVGQLEPAIHSWPPGSHVLVKVKESRNSSAFNRVTMGGRPLVESWPKVVAPPKQEE